MSKKDIYRLTKKYNEHVSQNVHVEALIEQHGRSKEDVLADHDAAFQLVAVCPACPSPTLPVRPVAIATGPPPHCTANGNLF